MPLTENLPSLWASGFKDLGFRVDGLRGLRV